MDYSNFGSVDFNTSTNNNKKEKSGVLGIILIILMVVVIGVTIYVGYKAFTEEDAVEDNNTKEEVKKAMTDEEALKLGEDLYKKGYEHEFIRPEELSMEDCKKAYDKAQEYFVKGTKVNYVAAYYRQEADIKYSTLESNYYNESGALSCKVRLEKTVDFYINEEPLKVSSNKEKVIVFDKVVHYCDKYTYDNMENRDDLSKCSKVVSTTYKFVIEKDNDDWKISRLSITH
jgi:hypothetical protein